MLEEPPLEEQMWEGSGFLAMAEAPLEEQMLEGSGGRRGVAD